MKHPGAYALAEGPSPRGPSARGPSAEGAVGGGFPSSTPRAAGQSGVEQPLGDPSAYRWCHDAAIWVCPLHCPPAPTPPQKRYALEVVVG